MTYVVGLVALLVLLAGVIAYAGDQLGAWAGRRRLSLLGARPKRTGQVVGVLVGILIMLTTLGVLSIAFRSATDTLLNAQRTAQQLQALRDQERFLQAQISGLAAELATAQAIIGEAQAARDAALAERDRLRSEVGEIETQLEQADARLLELDVLLAEADAALARADEVRAASESAAMTAILAASSATNALRQAEDDRRRAEVARVEAEEQRLLAQAQVDTLTPRVEELARLAAALNSQAEELRDENANLQASNDELANISNELVQRNQALVDQNAALQTEILVGANQVRTLEEQVGVLTGRLEEQARRLGDLQSEFSRVTSGEVTFARDQVVFSGALYATNLAEAREELTAFVRAASAATAKLGAGEVLLSAEQFEGLVEVIAETQGSDLVRLISPRNQFNPARVEVVVEALENTRLFENGRLLLARRVHMGSVQLPATLEDVRGWVAQLRADAIRMLRRTGLDELQAPIFVGSSDEAFANQLMRRSGQVSMGVITRGAIDRAGPAYVELIILD